MERRTEKGEAIMPYTVLKKENPLELAAKFFATPEGWALFQRECEKLRVVRTEEARQKELARES